jgi:peptidoglycan/xylan/chitin deacetylase (PgdA/CDA1 family)
MLRRITKHTIAGVLHHSGIAHIAGPMLRRHAPLIVAYHRIVEDFASHARHSLPSMLTSVATFERQIDWLARRYRIVSLDEAAALAGHRDAARVAAITFDDGYRDFSELAMPVLVRKGVPAALFVVTDVVGRNDTLPHDRLYLRLERAFRRWSPPREGLTRALRSAGVTSSEVAALSSVCDAETATSRLVESLDDLRLNGVLDALEHEVGRDGEQAVELRALDWDTLRAAHGAGITIGSHTRTHVRLPNESAERVSEEVAGSRRELERQLGARIDHFAYPGGRFDTTVTEAVAKSGYAFAYTTCVHRDPRHPELTLPRIVFWERTCMGAWNAVSTSIASCQVHRLFDWIQPCRHVRQASVEVR